MSTADVSGHVTWESLAHPLSVLQQFVDGSMGFTSGKYSSKRGTMSGIDYANARQLILQIATNTSSVEHFTPTSAGDFPYERPLLPPCEIVTRLFRYRAFIEQLQRIASMLREMIEGVIHGNQYEILDQFSKAWERFVTIYLDLIKNIVHLSLEADPEEREELLKSAGQAKTVVVQYVLHAFPRPIFVTTCAGTPNLTLTSASRALKCSCSSSASRTKKSCVMLCVRSSTRA